MTTRDRLVVMGIVSLLLVAAGWLLLVSPERQHATKISAEVSAAHQQLEEARAQVANAHSAQAQYTAAYASVVRLGKAVPPDEQVPSLVYQLDQASNQKSVNFSSITTSIEGTASTAAVGTPVAGGAFTAMPFTFVFKGSFFSLYHLFNQLNRFTLPTADGGIQVTGRLLTIQSANLDLKEEGGSSSPTAAASSGELTGTITATAYVLPAGQGLTAGATPTSPAGAPGASPATSGSSTSPTTPAVARVTP